MEKYAYIFLYTITLIVGLFYYKKYNHSVPLKLWILFLGYSLLTEIIGFYFSRVVEVRNYIVYNSWFLVNSFFYMIFFLNKLKTSLNRKLIIGLITGYAFYNVVVALFYKDYQSQYFVGSFMLGELCILVTVMFYYIEILKNDDILKLKDTMYFWISLGVLSFNIGMLPVFVIAELIDYQGVFNYIVLGANILMALCFITGFIVSKKETNT